MHVCKILPWSCVIQFVRLLTVLWPPSLCPWPLYGMEIFALFIVFVVFERILRLCCSVRLLTVSQSFQRAGNTQNIKLNNSYFNTFSVPIKMISKSLTGHCTDPHCWPFCTPPCTWLQIAKYFAVLFAVLLFAVNNDPLFVSTAGFWKFSAATLNGLGGGNSFLFFVFFNGLQYVA